MKKESIIALPDIRLRQPSRRVGLITDEIKRLVADMEAAALDWEDSRNHEIGVALAAVQVGRPLKVIIVRNNFEVKTDRTFRALINPEVTKYEGDIEEDYEGCLSVRDVYGKVARHSRIRVKARDLDGREIRFGAKGFLARVLQHEIDHTRGKLFVDYIKDKPAAFFQLKEDGQLEPLSYGKVIRDNRILWE